MDTQKTATGKAETRSHHKPHPCHSAIYREGTPNSQLLPEDWRVWTVHLATNFKDNHSTKGWPLPRHLALKANKACVMRHTRLYQTKKQVLMDVWVLTVAILLGLSPEKAGKKACLPVFLWKGFDYIHYKLLPESPSFNWAASRGPGCILSRGSGSLWVLPLPFPSGLLQR